MSVEFLSMLAGAALSLIASYVPKFSPWFKALAPDGKRVIMLGALLVVSLLIFAAGCAKLDLFGVPVTCDVAGGVELLKIFFFAAVANQGAFGLSPKFE